MNLNDFSHKPVLSPSANRSWLWLFMIETGVLLCIPILVLGGLFISSLPFAQAVAAISVSSIILAILSILVARVAIETRLTTALIAERAFGTFGAKIVAVVILFSFLGWWGFQTEIMAQTFNVILVNEGWNIPRWLSVGVCGAIMISTSILGAKAIGKVAYVLVPILIIALMVLLLHAQNISFTQIIAFQPPNPLSFGQVVGMLTGGVIVAIVGWPDLARFLKTQKDGVLSAISIYVTMAIIYVIAMVLSIAYNTPNIVEVLPTLGFSPLAIAVVFLATWSSNDKNLYAATIGISAFTKRFSRVQLTALAGFIGIMLAYIGIFNHLVTILTLFGIITSPIAALYILDYLNNPKRYQKIKQNHYPIRWLPIGAWTVGASVGLATTPTENLGLELFSLTTAPSVDAFIVAGLVFYVLPKINKRL